MRLGRTLTHHFEIETRQYDLLGIDLGEGARRRMIIFGAVVVVAWVLLLVPILGVPTKTTTTLYVVPPFVITAFGWRPGKFHERRRRITEWALAIRYALRAHRPVIGLGARVADRSEYLRWADRVPLHRMAAVKPGGAAPEWATLDAASARDADEPRDRAGSDVIVSQRARLIGSDYLQRIRRRTTKKRPAGRHA